MRLYDRATKKGRLICYQQTMSGISWGIYETAARAGAGAVRGRGGGRVVVSVRLIACRVTGVAEVITASS